MQRYRSSVRWCTSPAVSGAIDRMAGLDRRPGGRPTPLGGPCSEPAPFHPSGGVLCRVLARRTRSAIGVSAGRLDSQYSVGASASSGHSISSQQSGRMPSHQPCSAEAAARIGRSPALPAGRTPRAAKRERNAPRKPCRQVREMNASWPAGPYATPARTHQPRTPRTSPGHGSLHVHPSTQHAPEQAEPEDLTESH